MTQLKEKFSIIPLFNCQEATEIWNLLPAKENLTGEDAMALATTGKHRREITDHDPMCFTQRVIN